jgi:hypothetical protein
MDPKAVAEHQYDAFDQAGGFQTVPDPFAPVTADALMAGAEKLNAAKQAAGRVFSGNPAIDSHIIELADTLNVEPWIVYQRVLAQRGGENLAETRKVEAEKAKKIFESGVDEARSMRLKDRAAAIAANALGKEAESTIQRISDLSNARDKEKNPERRALLDQKLEAVQAAWNSHLDQNVSGEAVQLRTDAMKAKQAYRRKYQAARYMETILKNPDILGFAPSALQKLRNVAGVASEVTDLITPSVRAVVNNPSMPEDFRRRADMLFFQGRDPDTGVRLEEGKLREAALKWMLIMGVNESGRSTQKQIDEFAELTNAIGMTTSRAVGLDRMRATYKTIVDDMNKVDRPQLIDYGVRFNGKGQIEGDESSWESGSGYPMIDEAFPGQLDSGQARDMKPRTDPVTKSQVRAPVPEQHLDPLVQRMIQLKREKDAQSQ